MSKIDIQIGKCATCKHSKIDKVWGEVKCLKLTRTIYRPEEMNTCVYYKKDSSKTKATEEDEE